MSQLKDLPESSPEITPEVLHLRDLLKAVREGRIRVPHFQRDFTWNRQQMQQLFDSILRQYPIGTLLLWESHRAPAKLSRLGPLLLPDSNRPSKLLLDGQQRLTTLAGVLLYDLLEHAEEESDPLRWLLYFDAAVSPTSNPFRYFSGLEADPVPDSAVRVSSLMDMNLLADWVLKLKEKLSEARSDSTTLERAKVKQWTDRARDAMNALNSYRIPVMTFYTDSLKLAVESFARLNKSGRLIGPDELVSALTYQEAEGDQEAFRLSTQLDGLLSDLSQQDFAEVGRVTLLRLVLVLANMDPYSTSWDALASDSLNENRTKLMESVQKARVGIAEATQFLKEEGIPNGRLLPYAMQLVGMAVFFGVRQSKEPLNSAQRKFLSRWLWVTSFTEGFGGLNPSRLTEQLVGLRDSLQNQPDPRLLPGVDLEAKAHPFPSRYDLRSARVRALLCVFLWQLRRQGCLDEAADCAQRIQKHGPEALARIVFGTRMTTEHRLLSSPANRLLILKDSPPRKAQRRWLLEMAPHHDKRPLLEGLGLTPELLSDLERPDDGGSFIQRRIKLLQGWEVEFMYEKGVNPPSETSEPVSSQLDAEDEAPLNDVLDPERPSPF